MTSRERFMTALNNGRPDRLPCQVHGWMTYYLDKYVGTDDWIEANKKYGFDNVLYVSPLYTFADSDIANYRCEITPLPCVKPQNTRWKETFHTPEGDLWLIKEKSPITTWTTEPLIKNWDDMKLWMKYYPVLVKADLSDIDAAYERLGDDGIIRSHSFYPNQGSPWQAFCWLVGTTEAIFMAMDDPDLVHEALNSLLDISLKTAELWKGTKADMIELGGGAGSNTVISPDMFREFCVPYDQKQNDAYHSLGLKTVYHLCGGLMKMLDLVVENGSDGLETMTPPEMGGDCDLREASRRVGDKLFFIGGFDQNRGFENGTPEVARKLVLDCFEATRDHAGYIIAPSDHFFEGAAENLRAFCDAVHECTYD